VVLCCVCSPSCLLASKLPASSGTVATKSNALPGEPGNKSVVRLGFAWWPFVPVSSKSLSPAQRTHHLTPGGQAPKSLGTPRPPTCCSTACLRPQRWPCVPTKPTKPKSTAAPLQRCCCRCHHFHFHSFPRRATLLATAHPSPPRTFHLFPICSAACRAFYAPSRSEASQRVLPRRPVVAFAFSSSTAPHSKLGCRSPISPLPSDT
jgi:hypothetical protein